MQTRQEQITNLMWKEVAAKGTTATFAFSFIAIIIYFYHFGETPSKELIKSSCLVVLLANTLRLWVSKKIDPEIVASKNDRNILRVSVWINASAWSVIFCMAALERSQDPFHFAIMITLMTGFLTASIVTLAYDKTIYLPFQGIILFPLVAVISYTYHIGKNPQGMYLVGFILFYFFYQIKQYRDYRLQLIQRFSYQLDLEISYEELKRSQKAFVEQTAKLIHASKISALGEMAGGLAHEVNNSLMVILGSTQQMERKLKQLDVMNDDFQTKIDQSTNSIMRIKSVIEGLKNFSLQMEPTPKEVVSLKELIERTLNYCQELLSAHHIQFDVGQIPDVEIKCQPFQIIQILFNLTKNADDAVWDLDEQQRWIKYKFEIKNKDVLIKVQNGGPAIRKENIERLFQPFFTTKDVGKGTGLSLSISKGFAMDHKGDLYLDSATPYTSFVLRLPTI